MQIEAGKFYRTRDGRKIGPMRKIFSYGCSWEGNMQIGRVICYYENGAHMPNGHAHENDLVSEWTDGTWDSELSAINGPIRTITRKEIVPGIYGQVKVGEIVDVPDCERPDNPAALYIYVDFREACLSADELEAAAIVLTQIAGVLREN